MKNNPCIFFSITYTEKQGKGEKYERRFSKDTNTVCTS